MLKVVHDADASNENGAAGGSLLDEIVRDGARAMLAAALQAEVAAYIDAHADEVDENGSSAGGPQRLPRPNGRWSRRRGRCRCGRRGSTTSASTRTTGERHAVLLGDPAGVGAQVSAGGRGAAAAVPAWPVQQRLRPGVGAVPRVGRGPVGGDDHPADRAVARRRRGVQQALVEGHRLRVRVGRRDPPQGPPGAGQGVPAGDDRGARRRQQGTGRACRWVPRVQPSRGPICCGRVAAAG